MADNVMTYEVVDGVALVTIDSPPVNALSYPVRKGILEGFEKAESDETVSAVVLMCGGRTFIAGADISEFETGMKDPQLVDVLAFLDRMEKVTVAAIHGTALGGGLETALHCHYRIAVPSAKVGLPEVHLGLLPGAGGTQRLPRLVGAEKAVDMMVSGNPVKAPAAAEMGIIDAVTTSDDLKKEALEYARRLVHEGAKPRRVREMDVPACDASFFEEYRKKNAKAFKGFKAPENIVKAVEAATELPYDKGIEAERSLFLELMTSPESDAQRYVFFAQRATTKIPDLPKGVKPRDIKKVGVIGAGTMGGGITMNFLQAGIPVTLVEVKEEALERGIGVIRKNYENAAKKGRFSDDQVEKLMGSIDPALEMEKLADCDLVIEAVFEEMSVKRDIFGKLDKICKKGAVLASNTSFLDLNEIAEATSRPEDVIGLHFFSPANVMPLLEIVRGDKTADDVLATALAVAKTIRKTPVVARVCHGFIANRAMEPYMFEGMRLALEGIEPQRIDGVMRDYGFAMGPLQMLDLIGLDVMGRESNQKTLMSELVRVDRLGQKKNGGFYDYDEKRRPSPSPKAAEVIGALAKEQGVEQRDLDDGEILDRLLYPIINEGAKIVEEGIAIRPSDVDVALIMGYGWPTHKGGPMKWADQQGLDTIVEGLREFEATYGDRFKPASLLVKMAKEGNKFSAMKG